MLAVSGGLDSVVMTHLFAQNSYRFAVAHVNFGLRGAESDGDERWVAVLARDYEVPYFTQRFVTSDYAANQKISTQMAARRLRYAWFEEIRQQQGYARIATAHHQDDQLETTLLNLCQGTGVAGLRGMLARRGHLVRPLLFARRSQIALYAQEHALTWREDRSNASTKYRRNFIRHLVIPRLEEINPKLRSTYQLTQERLLATEQLLAEAVKQVEKQCRHDTKNEVRLDKAILYQHPQLPLVLSEILRPFGFSYVQSRDVADSIKRNVTPGKTFCSTDYQLLIDRQYLILSKPSDDTLETVLINPGDTEVALSILMLRTRHCDKENYQISRQPEVGALDADRLSFPLTLRPWRPGDWFCPLGMDHRKKLSDFLVDQKLPRHRKAAVYVLTSGEDIVWVVGHRVDHRFRITEATRNVYEISVTSHE